MKVKITDSKGMEVFTAQDRYLQILFFNKQCCHQHYENMCVPPPHSIDSDGAKTPCRW